MAWSAAELFRRINSIGISAGPVGATIGWTTRPAEQDLVRRMFVALGDRRLLFGSGCGVPRREMIASCATIRSVLTETAQELPKGSPITAHLITARAATQVFQEFFEDKFTPDGYGGSEEDFYVAIGAMRAAIMRELVAVSAMTRVHIDGTTRD